MEREYNNFDPKLLQMMINEEREKFVSALKNGASWVQLYKIRSTIRRLNEMLEASDGGHREQPLSDRSNDPVGPRALPED